MSKSAFFWTLPRTTQSTPLSSAHGSGTHFAQSSRMSVRRSLKGLSATTPASMGSRAACISAVEAPMETPQMPMRVKPRFSRRCSMTHRRSSRSKKPSDVNSPPLMPDPAKSKQTREMLSGSRMGTSWKPCRRLLPWPWQKTTQARSSPAGPRPPEATPSRSWKTVHSRVRLLSLTSWKSVLRTGQRPTVNDSGYLPTSSRLE
mmetsp:Transcript_5732/g.15393  ORF Transcript_5732/g.15393 Transcript_5732/m.15393 type:complete len:203 (-) Transcript_5732:8-616(-)